MCLKINVPLCCLWGLGLVLLPWSDPGVYAQGIGERGAEEAILERIIELLSGDQSEESESPDLSDYSERLLSIHARPFDLNKVSADELRSLGFLSPLVIGNILEHRRNSGRFISIHELQVIEGLDLEMARFLRYFLVVREAPPLENISYQPFLRENRHELLIRHSRILEKQAGYLIRDTGRSRYLGSPDRLLLMYRYQYAANLRISLTMEKDPGEQFFGSTGQFYGFDFYSGNMHLTNIGTVASVLVGDYQLQFGQGLGIWQGFSPGKGALIHGIAKQGAGLRPHTSADEINFFRGAAASIRWKMFRFTPFISLRQRDGRIVEDPDGNKNFATLGTSGLHRTPHELAGRQKVSQRTYGLNMEVDRLTWKFGGTFYRNRFGADWIPQPLIRNRFAFSGSNLSHGSMYYQFNFRNGYFFGETALSRPGGLAVLNGVLLSLHHHLSLGLLQRHYQRNHYSFFGAAFGAGSSVSNEHGFYTGFVYQPNRKFSGMFYYDLFRFPWLKYRVDAPSRGLDFFSEFSYSRSKQTKLSARFRYRESQRNIIGGEHLPRIGLIGKRQYRLSYETRFESGWRFRNRLEYIVFREESSPREHGWMFFQDLFYQPLGSAFSGNLRLALFSTSSYETRIYAFENDVLYAGSFPMYHNRGIRAYLNGRWKVGRRTDLWMRYAVSRYRGVSEIGSGLDQLSGPLRSELKTQLRIKIP